MAVNEIDGITNNPRFQELVRERSSFAWTLSIVMLVIYYGFILLVAFGKGFSGDARSAAASPPSASSSASASSSRLSS